MGLRNTASCLRCGQPDVDFLHLVWHCPKVCAYWTAVYSCIADILGDALLVTPLSALLGYPKDFLTSHHRLEAMLL